MRGTLTAPRQFNLMFKTYMGPIEEDAGLVYLRPETAQGTYVNFQNVQTSMRRRIPFGIAQIGKSFRNEISPGNFTYRMREFEQMEMQYFIAPEDEDEVVRLLARAALAVVPGAGDEAGEPPVAPARPR